MRITGIVLVVLIATVGSYSPTADDLRGRLGKPDSVKNDANKGLSEEYSATPSLKVLVNYSRDGRPSYLRLSPANSTLKDVETDPVVHQEILRKVVEGLIPKTERGKYMMGTFLNIICLPKNDCAGVE